MNLAIYTCFIGSDSNRANCIPPLPDGIDGYYFTNNKGAYLRVAQTRWTAIWMDIPQSPDPLVSAEQTKHLRCCPHEYPLLRPYRYLCWMDSNLRIRDVGQLWDMVSNLESSASVWAFTRHPLTYTDIWGEFHESMKYEKYARQRERSYAYIESRLQAGYDEHKPTRVCSGFSVRRQCPLVKDIGEFWYSEIQECGIECQISFQFVHQKYENNILLFPYQHCWTYL